MMTRIVTAKLLRMALFSKEMAVDPERREPVI
jgi:hypothetical protein